LATPLANEATKLERARAIQAASSASTLLRTMAWNAAMSSRASTSSGTPLSIAAMVIVSAFERA
jgi:hypothetical protein